MREIFGDVGWLEGMRVVEVTTGVAAPLIGRVLAELGAEVVKVESRAKIDVNRARLPRPDDPEGFPADEAFQLLHEANADKKSVTLNLKTEEGKELFRTLLGDADLFIENFAPGWLERLGMPVATLLDEFPALVVVSASGYGQTGPLRTQRAYAPVMTSLAGVEGLIGYADGEVVGCSALALADLNCTFSGVFLALAALYGRRRTGRGQHADISQTEACVSLIGEAFVEQQLERTIPRPRGNQGPEGEPWSVLPAAGEDEWVVAAGDVPVAADRPDRETLLGRLRERGLDCAPVLSPAAVARDERFAERGFLQNVGHPHPLIGELTITSVPWQLDGAVPRVGAPAPCLGQHNEEVFGRHLSARKYGDYVAKGVFH
ncbi:CaiB/BaiF CoA transferase family protein [Amycolatopsis sp.]|uniref:CaiB/BaiF CoA transferase family protein n=1 Tax=Amycolatopsis sp. TaxID=37632 RepID=UPI002B85CA0D|nr:CoA transferase [Amycolatopsis sp.]HVV11244.1 CoA transferase [Amycolatopsis sp.]